MSLLKMWVLDMKKVIHSQLWVELDKAEVELDIQDGLIVGANVVNGGFGFTKIPDLRINSDDTGSIAKLSPVLEFIKVDDATQLTMR